MTLLGAGVLVLGMDPEEREDDILDDISREWETAVANGEPWALPDDPDLWRADSYS